MKMLFSIPNKLKNRSEHPGRSRAKTSVADSSALSDTYRCARSLEAIENYARADAPFIEPPSDRHVAYKKLHVIWTDLYPRFWSTILANPSEFWGHKFLFREAVLSEWVARVPGLYWTKGAEALRYIDAPAVDLHGHLQPWSKSRFIYGGIGTLKFPPDGQGRRLCTLTIRGDASTGVPVLIDPEVWEHYEAQEGRVLTFEGTWEKMEVGWAERFPSTSGIPRGYILIKDVHQVEDQNPWGDRRYKLTRGTQIHPCTVMEYRKGNLLLWDYVFATARTGIADHRKEIATFFEEYKDQDGRCGRYLLAADISEPLWDADYTSPEQLRRAEIDSNAQLDFIRTRVHDYAFQGRTTEMIADVLASNYSVRSMQTLSDFIQIPPSQWEGSGSRAQAAVRFMEVCISQKRTAELLDAIVRQYPDLILPGVSEAPTMEEIMERRGNMGSDIVHGIDERLD